MIDREIFPWSDRGIDYVRIDWANGISSTTKYTDAKIARDYAAAMELGNEEITDIWYLSAEGGMWHVGRDAILANREAQGRQ